LSKHRVASSNIVTPAGPLALRVDGGSLADLASEPLSSGNVETVEGDRQRR
jgi:hypothetical protein